MEISASTSTTNASMPLMEQELVLAITGSPSKILPLMLLHVSVFIRNSPGTKEKSDLFCYLHENQVYIKNFHKTVNTNSSDRYDIYRLQAADPGK